MSTPVPLEAPRRLSESSLWRTQEAFYRTAGPKAWASGDVPHTLTSGPLLARAYAEMVTGYLLDAASGAFGDIDLTEPVYVVELGSGTGRLAFHFLRALQRCQSIPFDVVYVLTDTVESNLEFWRGHRRLLPHFAAGHLDLAHFEVTGDLRIHLEHHDRVLDRSRVRNPLVTIANYLFDVIPQDLYVSANGELFELEVALATPVAGTDLASPDLFREVLVSATPTPLAPNPYPEPEFLGLLKKAGEMHEGEDRFLFPAAALRCIDRLVELSSSRLLLLIAERPGGLPELSARDDEIDPPDVGNLENRPPGALLGMGIHGQSCSLPVDLGIVSEYFENHGGSSLFPQASPTGLLVAAFVLGAEGTPPILRQRFLSTIEEGGPEDLFLALRSALDARTEELPLALALALLRVSGYDPYLLRELYKVIEHRLGDAVPAGVDETFRVLREVAAREYPIDQKTDVGFGVAMLFAKAGYYPEALELLNQATALHGVGPHHAFNSALCLLHLERVDEALESLDVALELDPAMSAARTLRDEVISRRAAMEPGSGTSKGEPAS